jgi:hypothetical protein
MATACALDDRRTRHPKKASNFLSHVNFDFSLLLSRRLSKSVCAHRPRSLVLGREQWLLQRIRVLRRSWKNQSSTGMSKRTFRRSSDIAFKSDRKICINISWCNWSGCYFAEGFPCSSACFPELSSDLSLRPCPRASSAFSSSRFSLSHGHDVPIPELRAFRDVSHYLSNVGQQAFSVCVG